MVDTSRETEGVKLPPEVSSEIIQKMQDQSVVMQLAQQRTLSGAGKTFHEILSDPEPAFVGETERKPVSNPELGARTMGSHKIAVVSTYSDEFRRDLPGLFQQLLERLPGALGRAFDRAALHGIGAPSADFDHLGDAQTIAIDNANPGSVDAYQGFLSALATVPRLNRWALAPQGEIVALSNRDVNGSPIFVNSPMEDGSIGRVLGRDVFRSEAVADAENSVFGIGGDWNRAMYGVVEDVSVDISDNPVYNNDGTLRTAGWQDNMIAVRAEIHLGFIADPSYFVRLTADQDDLITPPNGGNGDDDGDNGDGSGDDDGDNGDGSGDESGE